MIQNKKILLVEDDPYVAEALLLNLKADGYEVVNISRGTEVIEEFSNGNYDLVLMDIMLPGKDGITLCEEIRASGSTTPVLFISARSETEEKIEAILSGGDDFISKPFDMNELKARMHGIFRRMSWLSHDTNKLDELKFGNCYINFQAYFAEGPGGEHKLTQKECLVIKYLVEREGQVVSRDQLLDAVWGYNLFPTNRTIDNFILKLRKIFERDPKKPIHIETIRGIGYRFKQE